MDNQTLETLRRTLVDRGRSLTQRRRRGLAAAQELLEQREADWEDTAAEQAAAAQLDRLGESDRLQLARIRASLDRMDGGRYGECVVCHGPIDDDRLRALPEADRCGGCAPGH